MRFRFIYERRESHEVVLEFDVDLPEATRRMEGQPPELVDSRLDSTWHLARVEEVSP